VKIKDIKKGDIITYLNGDINYVNKPYKYEKYFDRDFYNWALSCQIVKIQRYVKFLGFYRLKTIYKRGVVKNG